MAIQSDGPAPVNIRRIAFVLAAFSFLFEIFLVAAPYWRVTAMWGTAAVIANIYSFEGIFLSCLRTMGSAGTNQCYQMPAFGGVPSAGGYPNMAVYNRGVYAYLNAFRAFMIIALILSLAGVVCSGLGMRCTSLMEEDSKGKRWVVIAGGICHLSAGTLTGISASWYAAEVVREYYDPYFQNQKMKYTLGACLYIGWLSMVCSLLCGFLMVCCTCFNKPTDDSYDYQQENQEKYAMPRDGYDGHRSDPYYKEKYSYHKPDYYHSSGRDHYRSKDKRSSSSEEYHKSSRHSSDIIRSSGYI